MVKNVPVNKGVRPYGKANYSFKGRLIFPTSTVYITFLDQEVPERPETSES